MIHPDLPINRTEEDTLNRGTFARSLARTLTNYSLTSSLTVGLYGAWGSGKTSLLNMVLEAVEETDPSAVILRFNPWICADASQLITQFFRQLSAAIRLKKPMGERTWELIDQYAGLFELANLIPGAGGVIAASGGLLGKIAKNRIAARGKDLQKSKDQIVEKLMEEDIKIIVSIDDIDRLSEDEIVAVFQLVKALADFPKTIYLLAFDYQVVVKALEKVQHGDGREYLEKIIQVPFEIPAIRLNDVHQALFSKLEAILGDIPEERWDKATWAELFRYGMRPYFHSLRDVIRFSNVFMLKYELLKEETDPVDLLGLTCLQVFEPRVFSGLPEQKDRICGTVQTYSTEQRNAEEEKGRKAMQALLGVSGSVTDQDGARSILGILFPRIREAAKIRIGTGRIYASREFLIHRNIAVPQCFDRYFALCLDSDDLPSALTRELLFETDEEALEEGIMAIYHQGKIVPFLEETEAYTGQTGSLKIPPERGAIVIRGLCRCWSRFEVDDHSSFALPFDWHLLYIVDPILKTIDAQERFSLIQSFFEEEAVSTATLTLLLNDFEVQQGKGNDGAAAKADAVFSVEEVLSLEQLFLQRIRADVSSGRAMREKKGLDFLWLLEKIDASAAEEIRKTAASDDLSLIKVIGYCISLGTAYYRIAVQTRNVSLTALSKFLDTEEAYRRVKTFTAEGAFEKCDPEDQRNIIAFLHVMEHPGERFDGKQSVAEDVIDKELEALISGKRD